MTKTAIIALADVMREELAAIERETASEDRPGVFNARKAAMKEKTWGTIERLADFCGKQNPQFNRSRWIQYIQGRVGPNGGAR